MTPQPALWSPPGYSEPEGSVQIHHKLYAGANSGSAATILLLKMHSKAAGTMIPLFSHKLYMLQAANALLL